MREPRAGDPTATTGATRPRASDAQRTAVLEALDAAFADGRLSRLEHLERTRTVTRSRYIDELRPLVADLRGAGDDLGLGNPEPEETADAPSRRRGRSGAMIATAVAITAIAGGAIIASVSGGSPSAESERVTPGPLHTIDGLTRMLEAADAEFGDQPIDTLGISGRSATLMQEDPTEPGKRLIYTFRGEWQESNFDSHPARSTFRLGGIDPEVVMGAIDAAPGELGMDDDAHTSHVSVYPDAVGDPEFVVNVSEGPGEPLGQVTVGAGGEIREVRMPR